MHLAFMSSVCPKLDLKALISKARGFGYQGIEFRPEWDHGHGIELDASPEARGDAKKLLADSGIEPCCLAPGVRFCRDDRDRQFDLMLRYIDLARDIGIPRIRVFGDPIPSEGGGARAASYRVQADYLARSAEKAAEAGIRLVLETHSNFRGFDAGEVMFHAGYPQALWINWHLGHCLRHGEDVDEAYRHVKGRVDHAHFSLGEDKVNLPHIQRQAQLLAAEGFQAFFSVEVINPDSSDPVLEDHINGWKQILKGLGL